ncbi:MAG: serine hydrolase domain-containing protein [Balneolaceae bacterium]
MSSKRLQYLTNTFEEYIDDGKLPGVVIMLSRNGKVPYFESIGKSNLENNTEMEDDAIFRIASQTKAIVSVAIMMLQEQGKLLIKDPVGKYIPEFLETSVAVPNEEEGYQIEAAKRPITIRDLLTHTSGIGYGYGTALDLWAEANIQGWYFADREEPILETVKRMADLPFDAQPGEEYVYGYSTDILGALIEVISGQSLDTFLQENILVPLKMDDTHFYLPESKLTRLATVYSLRENEMERASDEGTMLSQGHYANGPRISFSGGAGLLSTASDYTRFLQMMLNEGELDGVRLLSPKTVELMTVNHLGDVPFPWNSGTGFGLGFSILEDLGSRGTPGSEGEYGWGGAYHSVYWVDPEEELVVTYFTQLIPASGLLDHEKLRTLIYQSIID